VLLNESKDAADDDAGAGCSCWNVFEVVGEFEKLRPAKALLCVAAAGGGCGCTKDEVTTGAATGAAAVPFLPPGGGGSRPNSSPTYMCIRLASIQYATCIDHATAVDAIPSLPLDGVLNFGRSGAPDWAMCCVVDCQSATKRSNISDVAATAQNTGALRKQSNSAYLDIELERLTFLQRQIDVLMLWRVFLEFTLLSNVLGMVLQRCLEIKCRLSIGDSDSNIRYAFGCLVGQSKCKEA
jgi:hypothetical protein